jgi:AcrR family transcriptional regulator
MTKNELRAANTKARLVAAARGLFARDGYAQTGTEAILAEAGVKRGALYHHYRDKADLFEAVCRELAAEAAEAVRVATDDVADPIEALEKGSVAWIDYMARPESRQILVVDAPGVLGRERWDALDRELSFDLLRAGTAAAADAGALRFAARSEVLAVLLNGAMNQIAMRGGDDNAELKSGLIELLRALKR